MTTIFPGNRLDFHSDMILCEWGVEGMVLGQPFPLPFAFTNFGLLAEGQHVGSCALFPQAARYHRITEIRKSF